MNWGGPIEDVLGGERVGLGGIAVAGMRRTVADLDLEDGAGGGGGGVCTAFPPAFGAKWTVGDFDFLSISFALATTGSALKRGVSEPPLLVATTFSVPIQFLRCEYGRVLMIGSAMANESKRFISSIVYTQPKVVPTLQSFARCGSFVMCSTID